MEATTLLTLILLAVVGARNIPVKMNEPSGKIQQIIGDSITSYANTVPEDEVFNKDPIEHAVSAGDIEPTSNKDINEEETSEDHDQNVAAMVIKEAKNLESQPKEAENQETTTEARNSVEVTKKDSKTHEGFEDREGIKVNFCPDGARMGPNCWPEDKD